MKSLQTRPPGTSDVLAVDSRGMRHSVVPRPGPYRGILARRIRHSSRPAGETGRSPCEGEGDLRGGRAETGAPRVRTRAVALSRCRRPPRRGNHARPHRELPQAVRRLPEGARLPGPRARDEAPDRRPPRGREDPQQHRAGVLGDGRVSPRHRPPHAQHRHRARNRRPAARGRRPEQPEPRLRRAWGLPEVAGAIPARPGDLSRNELRARRKRHAGEHRRRLSTAGPVPRRRFVTTSSRWPSASG